jgi:hypothetical protein
MNSDRRNGCSHPLGFPIRKSPDHSLLAASRSLSQLTTSFIAYLRQGIHTHALSSLTIKSTSHTNTAHTCRQTAPAFRAVNATFFALYITCVPATGSLQSPFLRGTRRTQLPDCNARQIFSCQRTRLRQQSVEHGGSTNGCNGGPGWT